MKCTAIIVGKDQSERIVEVPYPPFPVYKLPFLIHPALPFGEDPPVDRPSYSYKTFTLSRTFRRGDVRWRYENPTWAGFTMEPAYVYFKDSNGS